MKPQYCITFLVNEKEGETFPTDPDLLLLAAKLDESYSQLKGDIGGCQLVSSNGGGSVRTGTYL